ncbi:MAG TPA: hypothetical protein VJ783_18160 [Pirellulales bacterium]|nr:hypothetical protein [Pirellulales bacterium]
MAGTFDPYREWLAITSGGESHNYYELLGVRPLESDIGKINEAFRRQSDRLAPHLSGAQAAMAQRLMTELTEARMTLLTPTTKRNYDQALAGGRSAMADQPMAAAPKSARWRGSPAPENDDALLPPTAIPASANASATPIQAAASGAAPLASGSSAPEHPQAVQATAYPMSQAVAWPATAAPTYPGWHGTNPGVAGQAPPYGGYAVPAAGYPAAVPGYSAQPYPADGYAAQAGPQGYPPQGYPPHGHAAQTPYVAAPTALAEAAPQVSTFSAASYRAGRRRRSSSAPLVAGVLLAALAILGGVYWKVKSDRTVAANPAPRDAAPEIKKSPPRTTTPPKPMPAAPRKTEATAPSPKVVPTPPEPEKKPELPKAETPQPEMPTVAAPPKPVPETTAKSESPPKPDVPAPDARASAEEAAAVSRALRAARAALAVRDTALAQEQVDQATLEATAPDTLAQVERLELLTRYAEGFWEAARGTLGKLQVAEEIKIDDEVASVVEVSQDGLTLRVGGRNREYTMTTLPTKIALYLARRWLAPDDPGSDVAVAAFLMTDPKGDRQEARRLLQSAAARGIDVKPLLAELDAEKK